MTPLTIQQAEKRLLDACEAWKAQPCPANWWKAKEAALLLLKLSGTLPRGARRQSEAAFAMMHKYGACASAALDNLA